MWTRVVDLEPGVYKLPIVRPENDRLISTKHGSPAYTQPFVVFSQDLIIVYLAGLPQDLLYPETVWCYVETTD